MRPRSGLLAAFGFVLAITLSGWTAPAGAMALPAAAGLKDAAAAVDVTETVGCRTVWRCGYYGCGWRQVCWAPRYSHYHRPYYRPHRVVRVYRPYGYYAPYYRPYRVYRPYPYYRPYIPPPWVSGPWGFYGPRFYW